MKPSKQNNSTFNTSQVKQTLSLILKIMEEFEVDYRLLGSVVTAAIMGKQHRALGDIDILMDISKRDVVLRKLHDIGYFQREGVNRFAHKHLDLDSLEHSNYLEIGIFWGTWENGNFRIGTKRTGVVIDARALAKLLTLSME